MKISANFAIKVHSLDDWTHLCEIALERGIPVQFHTGLHEGFGNFIQNSNPELLINLISEYKNVNFDLFHISYPYYGSACAIAKNFRNVTLDMCWAHVISPNAIKNGI